MSDRVPAGAYDDVSRLQTHYLKRLQDGKDATAFAAQAVSLRETRKAVNEHEDELAELRNRVAALEASQPNPFP